MAATDPEAARMAAKMHSGGFPLDTTINQFQPINPSAVLTAPPAPGQVATSVADLPSTPRTAGNATENSPRSAVEPPATPRTVSATAKTLPKNVASVAKPTLVAPGNVTWANTGLLGLLAIGGWFCWRTRRVNAPVS